VAAILFIDADEVDEGSPFVALDQYPQVANGVAILGDDSPEIVPLARDAIGPSSMEMLRTLAVSCA
jgi:hypothetical protein